MGLTVLGVVVTLFLFASTRPVLSTKNVECPDGQHYCPDANTCCAAADGTYTSCCPSPYINCCPGGLTCCPSGTSCGPDNKCYGSSGYTVPPFESFAQAKSKNDTKIRDTLCPDQSTCPDQQTCCAAAGGGYGCCPAPDASCCSDGKHCCRSGSVCGPDGCYSNDKKFKEKSTSILATTKMDKAQNVICPDGGSCPDGNTCCPTSSGPYGCCPFSGASCCSDGQHCCRSGYQCSNGQCFLSGLLHPMMTLI